MPNNYYPSNIYIPDILNLVLERIKLYFAKVIYPSEEYDKSKYRFVLANFEAGDQISIRRSIEQTVQNQQQMSPLNSYFSNATFPFTAYNIGEDEQVQNKSHLQTNGLFYDEVLNAGATALPHIINIPMITFYNTPYDYRMFRSIIGLDDFNLTRLYVPCLVNGVESSFPIDIDFEIGKGVYAFSFEEQLRVGKIFDVVHNVRCYYNKIVLLKPSQSSSDGKQRPFIISPVDDIELSVYKMINKDPLSGYDKLTYVIPKPPLITTTAPTQGEINFSRSDPIIITFNKSMDENSVISNLDIVPYLECKKIFNLNGTQLIIDHDYLLESQTAYTVLINKNAKSAEGAILGTDFTLNFTTGI